MKLSSFSATGGNLVLALNTVQGDFQTAQGTELNIGVREWLEQSGIRLNANFIVDASSGSITVQQRQGFFTINSALEFPYFPLVSQFEEHPVTTGLEQVIFQFVSSIDFIGDTVTQFVPIVRTSENTGIQNPPVYFNIEKQWTTSDFTSNPQTLGAIISRPNGGDMAVFGDGDFVLGAQGRGQTPDNVSLFVNAVDYLSDDTGLIDLRTKGVTSRPIKELDDAQKSSIKWISFSLPIVLILIYGFFRFQRNRQQRVRRMLENYT